MGLDGLHAEKELLRDVAVRPPAAASSHTCRWRGVSAAAPSVCARRGRRPVATSSRRACSATSVAPARRRRRAPGRRRARLDPAADASQCGAQLDAQARGVEQLDDGPADGQRALAQRDAPLGSGSATIRACSAATIAARAPKRSAIASSAAATSTASSVRRGGRARRPRSGATRPTSGALVAVGASTPTRRASTWARSKSPCANHSRARAWSTPISQDPRADLAVEPALAKELRASSKAPRSASVQTRTSTAPPVTALTSSPTISRARRAWSRRLQSDRCAGRAQPYTTPPPHATAASRGRCAWRIASIARARGRSGRSARSTRTHRWPAKRRHASASSWPSPSASSASVEQALRILVRRARSPARRDAPAPTRPCEESVTAAVVDCLHPTDPLALAPGTVSAGVERSPSAARPRVRAVSTASLLFEQFLHVGRTAAATTYPRVRRAAPGCRPARPALMAPRAASRTPIRAESGRPASNVHRRQLREHPERGHLPLHARRPPAPDTWRLLRGAPRSAALVRGLQASRPADLRRRLGGPQCSTGVPSGAGGAPRSRKRPRGLAVKALAVAAG